MTAMAVTLCSIPFTTKYTLFALLLVTFKVQYDIVAIINKNLKLDNPSQ